MTLQDKVYYAGWGLISVGVRCGRMVIKTKDVFAEFRRAESFYAILC